MEAAWRAVMAAAERPGGDVRDAGGATAGMLAWSSATGWACILPDDDPRRAFIDLYLPICNATAERPITVAHLGQSLDGFIATQTGESFYVTGEENIRHLHRLRALSDVIVVGAGTVAADNPQLTTRRVSGPNPLRVVLDPTRRLGDHFRLFQDEAVPTLYVCARSLVRAGETQVGTATVVAVDDRDGANGAIDVGDVVRLLHARGCWRIFVEGGGVTVSMFLEANLLDRLQVAIAPLIIGDGRPAIRVLPRTALADCRRPRYRVFRMGADILFDCDLRSPEDDTSAPQDSSVVRVI
jgi:diaminohydroxyphosphoribosylaminopyrimidine deaminase/5-amino-6-(5-phosphoribosylamino)uracil reductase